MASSGVLLDEEAVTIYNKMKLGHKTQYIVFMIQGGKIVVSDEVEQAQSSENKLEQNNVQWEGFCNTLPADDCRYAVFDFYMEQQAQQSTGNPRIMQCLIFIMWAPESAPIKKKMLYASSKEAIRKKFLGIQVEIQATGQDDLVLNCVEEKIARSKTRI